jgi:hypothetical protein
MSSKKDRGRDYAQRDRVVRYARILARSGHYPDVLAILPDLVLFEGFTAARERLEDGALLAQLNRLCTMAQSAPLSPGRYPRSLKQVHGRRDLTSHPHRGGMLKPASRVGM